MEECNALAHQYATYRRNRRELQESCNWKTSCYQGFESDADWVKEIWDNDFTDLAALDEDVEEEIQQNGYYCTELKAVVAALKPWAVGGQEESETGFWTVMVEYDISYQTLVALLFYYMETAQKRTANAEQKQAGILATRVYLNLITIPGSGAFRLFHPMLFHKGMKILKWWSQLGGKRKRKPSPVRASQGRRGGRAKKRSKEVAPSFDEDDDDDEDEESFTPREIENIRRSLIKLLQDVLHLLTNYSLRACDQSCQLALQVLVELTKQDPELFEPDFNHDDDFETSNSIPGLAFKGLTLLCNEMHGEVNSTITSIFKHLMPGLLMLIGDNHSVAATTIPRSIVLIKEHSLAYVSYLVQKFGDLAYTPARTLVQHLCIKVPDKADYRSRVSQVVISLLNQFPPLPYAKMIEWFYKFSRNEKTSYRGFAIDIIAMLLSEKEKALDGTVPAEISGFASHVFLVKMILMRCSDVAPTVRTRAISAFANCVSSGENAITTAIKDTITPRVVGKGALTRVVPTPDAERQKKATGDEDDDADDPNNNAQDGEKETEANDGDKQPDTPGAITGATPGAVQLMSAMDISLADGQGVTSMLRRRALDEKVGVRKSALHALESLVKLDPVHFNQADLDTIHKRCRDPALSVRKQAMQSLTDLVRAVPLNSKIQWAWLDGVLPLVMDRETSIASKCLDYLEENILCNITTFNKSTNECHDLVWQMLDVLASVRGIELRRYLQKAFHELSKQNRLKGNLATSLVTHVDTKNNTAAWMVLAEMAPSGHRFNPDAVLNYWEDHAKHAGAEEYATVERVLNVIGCIAGKLPSDTISDLLRDLKQRLIKFDSPPELITVTINTLSKLYKADEKEENQGRKDMTEWCSGLLKISDTYLSEIILNENAEITLNEKLIVCHLFTIGEIAQLCPNSTPKRVFMLIQSLIAAPCISSTDGSSQDTSQGSRKSTGSTSETDVQPSQSVASSQEPCTQGISGTQVLSQFSGSKMPTRVRAHAFITLGKLCLQNETLAKKVVPAMARELEISNDPSIRNNVVIIMCDLCVRYTTLINNYVANIASCVKDENALVRKQTLTLITHLLQLKISENEIHFINICKMEEYLKWKGALFYRFIMGLVDDVKEIREFTEFCLVHLLLHRNPGMFFQHFAECIFHFNAYEDHNVYNKFPQTEKEKTMFSLKGKQNATKRMTIYKFLLEHMSDENKFHLSAKLVNDVLGTMAEGDLPVDVNSSPLLQDTLAILASKEIKLSSMKAKPQEEIFDEQDAAAAVVAQAKKTIITEVLKKNVIDNIVPVVIALKHMLEKKLSPLQRDLMLYLRELMKDYKNEVKDIMAADRQLAKEIEFDMRKFEEQQIELEALAKKQATPTAMRAPVTIGSTGSARSSPVRGSPRTRTPAHVAGTPASTTSPGSAAKVVGTPKNASPVMALVGSRTLTPLRTPRNSQLSTVAIMNSAKKSMERARRLSVVQREKMPLRESPLVQSSRKNTSNRPASMSPTENSSVENLKLLPIERAISTPDRTIMNITFNPGEVTMLPPSPIPRVTRTRSKRRVRSQGKKDDKNTKKSPQDENSSEEENRIICLTSPEKPGPKPRVWNVTSPAPTAKATEEKGLADSSEEVADKNSSNDGSLESSEKSRRSMRTATRRSGRKK